MSRPPLPAISGTGLTVKLISAILSLEETCLDSGKTTLLIRTVMGRAGGGPGSNSMLRIDYI